MSTIVVVFFLLHILQASFNMTYTIICQKSSKRKVEFVELVLTGHF
nr:MAG TPA: hypothetical protein [Caudoviricetes sp.]